MLNAPQKKAPLTLPTPSKTGGILSVGFTCGIDDWRSREGLRTSDLRFRNSPPALNAGQRTVTQPNIFAGPSNSYPYCFRQKRAYVTHGTQRPITG